MQRFRLSGCLKRMLQRGRAHSSAEIWRTPVGCALRSSLQRGRAHSSAEIGNATGGSAPAKPGFNGAALIRARKSGFASREAWADSWLQRGRAHSSAEITTIKAGTKIAFEASTGPRSFERGNEALVAAGAEIVAASTGPRSFERGNQNSLAALGQEGRGFNGAALIRARK